MASHKPCPLDDLTPEQMAERRFKQGDLVVLSDWEKRHFRRKETREEHEDRILLLEGLRYD